MWNRNNPAIRRIQADVKELSRHPSDQYAAQPQEDNMFDWHFAIRGPKGTDFEGGVYHGRIVLPNDYPFKPPAIMLLTPNGRWRVKEKICLSISSYHPEQWQPAWGIRTILEALISFMTAPGDGAVGALDCSSEVRKQLAKESLQYKHPLMPLIPELKPEQTEPTKEELEAQEKFKSQISQLHEYNLGPETESKPTDEKSEVGEKPDEVKCQESVVAQSPVSGETPDGQEVLQADPVVAVRAPRQNHEGDRVDSFLEQISVALLMAIFAILYRKALQLYA